MRAEGRAGDRAGSGDARVVQTARRGGGSRGATVRRRRDRARPPRIGLGARVLWVLDERGRAGAPRRRHMNLAVERTCRLLDDVFERNADAEVAVRLWEGTEWRP